MPNLIFLFTGIPFVVAGVWKQQRITAGRATQPEAA